MRKCPVCRQSTDHMVCDLCGFDESQNREAYPTLGKYPTTARSIAAQRQTWDRDHQEDLLCSACGDRRFTVNRRTGQLFCFRCHAQQHTVPQPRPAVAEKITPKPGRLFVPPEGCQVIATEASSASRFDLSQWNNVVALSASVTHILGLKKDGTVLSAGHSSLGANTIRHWTDIRSVAADVTNSYAVKGDGTVAAAGFTMFAPDAIKSWKNMASVSVGGNHLFGLTRDGRVLTTDPGCKAVENWRQITAIAAGYSFCLGLHQDGTVSLVSNSRHDLKPAAAWKNITAIAAGDNHVVGLCKDGTVVAAGQDSTSQCSVQKWQNIVGIAAGGNITIGIRADGKVDCTRYTLGLSRWDRIVDVAVSDCHIIALRLSEAQYNAQRPKE